MATNSSQDGYLLPSSVPIEDELLEDALHDALEGMTGIPGNLVRPRWQPEPPTQPDFNTNWVAFGVVRTSSDVFAYVEQASDTEARVYRDELLEVLHSFYGPNCTSNAKRMRDGFSVGQNHDQLRVNNIALVSVGDVTHLPALLKEKWVQRVDLTVTYRRRSVRSYPVLTILSARVEIRSEQSTTFVNVEP